MDVANYYTLSGSKQHQYIISVSAEVQAENGLGSYKAKIKKSQDAVHSAGSRDDSASKLIEVVGRI